MKKCLIVGVLACLLFGCEDSVEPVDEKAIRIHFSQHNSSFLFAGLPAYFSVSDPTSPVFYYPPNVNLWTFGDGKSSSEISTYHTFDFPGKYKVSVFTDDGKGYKDTMLQVTPKFALIGSKTSTENGKFIFPNPTSGYTIIHTLNKNSSSDQWWMLSTSPGFDSLQSHKLPFESYSTVVSAFVNKRGNVVIVNERLWEFDHIGGVINSVYLPGGFYPSSTLELEDGYLITGRDFNGNPQLRRYDNSMTLVSDAPIDVTRAGYTVYALYFESERIVRIHYVETGRSNSPFTVVRRTLDGEVLFEKSYDSTYPARTSYALSTGYLLAGTRATPDTNDATNVFTKIDKNGQVEWSFESRIETQYSHSGRIRVLEDVGSVYLFLDNQKGFKVASDGTILWSKQFGISEDTFNDALINKSGHLIILGAHQYDYIMHDYTNSYEKKDLSLIAVDKDGNIVEGRE
jgi:hypothetical protein